MRTAAIVVVAALVMCAATLPALAQQGQSGGPGPGPRMQKEFTPEQFPADKARVLKMLDDRKVRLEQERACAEKATNHDELRKCRPEPPMGRMEQGGGQMRRGNMPPMPPQGSEAPK